MYTPYEYQRMGGAYRIGPYSSSSDCRSVNDSQFAGRGRCDCETIADPSEGYTPTGYTSSGSSRRQMQAQAQIQAEQEQQREREEEARRQEENRQRLAEEQAKKAAEAARKKIEWDQKKEELMASLRGASPGDFKLKEAGGAGDFKLKTGGEEIKLKPKGTDFFDSWLHQGNLGDMNIKGTVLDTKDSRKQTPPSTDSENLRRSLWLYKRAAMTKDPEEAAFLSQQADEAAQGHPLLVEVPGAAETPKLSASQLDQFQKLTESVKRDEILIQKVDDKRTLVEQKQTMMKDKLGELERKIEEQKKQTVESPLPSVPEPNEEAPKEQVPTSQSSAEAPAEEKPQAEEAKKAKGGEDLMAEYLALQKEIEKTDKEAEGLLKEQDKAQQSLEKGQQKLGSFLKNT